MGVMVVGSGTGLVLAVSGVLMYWDGGFRGQPKDQTSGESQSKDQGESELTDLPGAQAMHDVEPLLS